jgi:quinol monooxygenase YgiN
MMVRNSSRPIARVFRATAAPGCRDELLRKFHSSSAALVNSKMGCLKYRILEPVDASAPELVFESAQPRDEVAPFHLLDRHTTP